MHIKYFNTKNVYIYSYISYSIIIVSIESRLFENIENYKFGISYIVLL